MAIAKTRKEAITQNRTMTLKLKENSGITLNPIDNEIIFSYQPEQALDFDVNLFTNDALDWANKSPANWAIFNEISRHAEKVLIKGAMLEMLLNNLET